MPKLFVFRASDAPIALIVRRSNKGKDWQLIRWDVENDVFTEGQWLLNKKLWIDGCSLSSNGEFFYWIYNTYGQEIETHAGISCVPYFTAIMYGNKGMGRWDRCRFDRNTKKPINNQGLEFTNVTQIRIECIDTGTPDSTGLIKDDSWMDGKGRKITIQEYKIFGNDELIYDATENQYKNIPLRIA